ncbi:hypothetical protein ACFQ7Z_32325 [Streptomyces virginiae]|uniref:hypothetical protein n=1 Tax=Streptomyces virginiae TaxID=1961 RepID=UPI0036A7D8C1
MDARQPATAFSRPLSCACAGAAVSLPASGYRPMPSQPLRVPGIGNSHSHRCSIGATAIAAHRPTDQRVRDQRADPDERANHCRRGPGGGGAPPVTRL